MVSCCHLLVFLATLVMGISAQSQIRCVVDIGLVIDMSGSIMDVDPEANNWGTQMDFVKSMITALNVGIDMTRIAVVTFGNRAKLHFTLDQYKTEAEYLAAIDQIKYLGGNTNTTGGLKVARDQVFSPAAGDRPEVMNLIILLTDGNPTRDVDELPEVAASIRKRGMRIIGIGVTKAVNRTVFKGLVTPPFEENYFNVTNFGGLMTILDAIIFASCRTMPPTPAPAPTAPPAAACSNQVDVVFVVDTSGSINSKSFKQIRAFVADVITDLDVENQRARVGLVLFSDDSKTIFGLDKFTARLDMVEEVNKIIHDRGRTNTASAIRRVRNEIFRSDRGDREQAKNLMVIITDGASNDKEATLKEAFETKKEGLHTIVVSVGTWLDKEELTNMASYPYQNNVFGVVNANGLSGIKDRLREVICNNVNECLSNPCRNGGTCIDGIDMYLCLCPSKFSGVNCERRCQMASDVVFAIDASGSVGPGNFQKQVDFVKDIISGMNINVDSRVGVLTFSNNPSVKFYMNSFRTEMDLMNGLSIYYQGGTTNTASALSTLRQDMFTSARGERSDKPNIGIILTDGRSNNEEKTWNEAMKTRDAGIHLIAVGIGKNYRQRELQGIASYPVSRNTFDVESFDRLQETKDSLLNALCNDINECDSSPCRNGASCLDLIGGYRCACLEGFSGIQCERGCDGKLDIVFAIDSSGSIRNERFPYVRNFVHAIVENLEVSESRTRIGVLKWSDTSKVEFQLNKYKTKQDVLQHIRHITFVGGRTHTSSALREAKDNMFKSQNGDRDNVQNILIVVTDGNSNINADRTIPDAIDARTKGVQVIVISVGSSVNELELRGIASAPEEDNVYLAQSYQDLGALSSKIVSSTCNDINECESSPCQNGGRCVDGYRRFVCLCAPDWTGVTCNRQCRRQMDVVFVLDISGSTEDLFDLTIALTKRIIEGLPIRFNRARVGLVTFADTASIAFYLNTYTTKEEILNAVAFRAAGGKTNAQAGIAKATDEVFSSGKGDRNGVKNIMVVISDGRSNVQEQNTIPQAKRAHDRNIEVYATGVGESRDVDMFEINGIASDPDSEHVFRTKNTGELDSTAEAILNQLCQ